MYMLSFSILKNEQCNKACMLSSSAFLRLITKKWALDAGIDITGIDSPLAIVVMYSAFTEFFKNLMLAGLLYTSELNTD